MPKLSVILVNYNTAHIIERCLNNLLGLYENMEVIVVDNGSMDGSGDLIKSKYPQVILIESTNKGLSAGSNFGLEKATGDYILFLGTDAFPEERTLEGMVGYFEKNPTVGIATCKLLLRTGELDMDAHRGFPTPWAALTHFTRLNRFFPKSKIFNQYFLGYQDINVPHEIDLCISHFMFVRKKVFDQIGKWDEDYFVYGDDVDICYRAKQAGWKIMYLPQWKALHYKGVSVGIRSESKDITKTDPATKKRMKRSSTDAMRIFYTKHYIGKYPKLVTSIVLSGIEFLSKIRS
ncbi:MAG: glycosyltransferase family 2 protein [Patescibacteria group bacterium]|jgi:hypothetical protein